MSQMRGIRIAASIPVPRGRTRILRTQRSAVTASRACKIAQLRSFTALGLWVVLLRNIARRRVRKVGVGLSSRTTFAANNRGMDGRSVTPKPRISADCLAELAASTARVFSARAFLTTAIAT